MSRAPEAISLPNTLRHILETFRAEVVKAQDAAQAARESSVHPVRGGATKATKKAVTTTTTTTTTSTVSEDADAALTEAQQAALEELFPKWLCVLYAASNAVSGAATPRHLRRAGDDRSAARVAGVLHHPQAVAETAFCDPCLSVIPRPSRETAAALSARTMTRSRHAALPPTELDRTLLGPMLATMQADHSETTARLLAALSRLASLSWLHYSYLHLLVVRGVRVLSALTESKELRRDDDSGATLLHVLEQSAADLTRALQDRLPTEANASGFLSCEALTQVVLAIDTLSLPSSSSPSCAPAAEEKISALTALFFAECCRVAAGGDASSFHTSHVPVRVVQRVNAFLAARLRAVQTSITTTTDGDDPSDPCMRDAPASPPTTGVLVAVAVKHPMAATRVVHCRRPRARAAPPMKRWRHDAASHGESAVGTPTTTTATTTTAGESTEDPGKASATLAERSGAAAEVVVDVEEISDNSSDETSEIEISDSDDNSDNDDDDDELASSGDEAPDWVDDLSHAVSSRPAHHTDMDASSTQGSDAADVRFLQCEVPLASLLLRYNTRPASGEAVMGDGVLHRGEAYARVGHLCWCPPAGAKARQQHLLDQGKG